MMHFREGEPGLDLFKQRRIQVNPEQFKAERGCEFMVDFAKAVFEMDFDAEPNYSYLNYLLIKYMLDNGSVPNGRMDWSQLEFNR